MGTFSVAQKLLTKNPKTTEIKAPSIEPTSRREKVLQELELNNFSLEDTCKAYRELYDSTDDASVKRQILDKIANMQSMLHDDKVDNRPTIIINIKADPNKWDKMLCPTPVPSASEASGLIARENTTDEE